MASIYAENNGRFPDDSQVLVRYPKPGTEGYDRADWAWLPGIILGQCGPNEWHVLVEVRELATLKDGSLAPEGALEEDLLYPAVYRDATEIREVAH